MIGVVAILSGFLFALGLGLSGMVQPQIVRGFLDFLGDWDWRLMGVMIGAIGIHAVTYRFILRRSTPIFESKFQLPSKNDLDFRLIAGSILFGLGWGWAGICPGPGIVALASGEKNILIFVVSMMIGIKLFKLLDAKRDVWNRI